MTDQATQHLARTDEARAEVERYRAGEPTRGPLLWAAGLWETPAEALEALRSGAWQPVACALCEGAIDARASGKWRTCPLCLATGFSWSVKHAELAAYAGCESLRLACAHQSNYGRLALYGLGISVDVNNWARFLSDHYGTVPPVVAALGVVRAVSDDPALDAVERWCYWPSEANRLAVYEADRSLWMSHGAGHPLRMLLRSTFDHIDSEPISAVIGVALRDGLPETTTAQAARDEVRRWALKGLIGDPL